MICLNKKCISILLSVALGIIYLHAQVGVSTDHPISDLDIVAAKGKDLISLKDSSEKLLLHIDSIGRISVNSKVYPIKFDLRSDQPDSLDHALGVGYTNSEASKSGIGAIRYNKSTKTLEFSNEYTWVPLSAGKERVFFTGNIYNSVIRGYPDGNTLKVSIPTWNIQVDDSKTYDNGGFVAPRNGMYSANATIVLDNLSPVDGKILKYELMLLRTRPDEEVIEINLGGFKKVETYFGGTGDPSLPTSSKMQLANSCASIFYLDAGDRLSVGINLINTRTFTVRITNDQTLNHFTVVEM